MGTSRIHCLFWEKLCFLVEEGGMGFGNFGDSMAALSCKLWLRLHQNNFVWANFISTKYIQGQHPLVARADSPPSSWRRLEEIHPFAKARIQWYLGHGFVDFWYDYWCFEAPLAVTLNVINPPYMLLGEFFSEEWLGCTKA